MAAKGGGAHSGCGSGITPPAAPRAAGTYRPKTKTPETCVPGAFRMSLQLTGSSSPVSPGWGCEFPRLLHPLKLLPASNPRVTPSLGPSALISPGLQVAPNSQIDNCLSVLCRVTPISAPSGYAYGESPGRPGPSLRLRRHPADLRISPAIMPSGYTGRRIFRSRPEARRPASPSMRLRVSPAPASTAGR